MEDLENNVKMEYPSIRSVARALNASDVTLKRFLEKPYLGRYLITKKNFLKH